MNCCKIYEEYKKKCEVSNSNTPELKIIPNHYTSNAVNCINMIKEYSSCVNVNVNENKNINKGKNDKK